MENNSHQQRGNQLGQYRLGSRYRNTGELGRVYRAHHVETGRPALVVQRTERQADDAPLADWQVRVVSSVSPSYLALEVERAPEGGDPLDVAGELVFMLEDAAQVADTTINRPETMGHLLGAARPTPRTSQAPRAERASLRRPAFAAAAAALAAAALLHLSGSSWPGPAGLDAGDELALADDAGWGGSADEVANDLVLTAMPDEAPFLLAKALPKKPFSNQKRPPCDKQLEVEMNGGCWVRLKVDGTCPPDKAYEHQGECFLPAAKPTASPAAVSRQALAFDRQ
ncbi:hypothetical protein JQX13_50290 [Archangium violaceum]|uniref:hypothetical protein n=1 Tax=Archangium violaceum TaxID=83451 RepID=UPI00193B5611|nr:hypothetical protein [Archangium violaceum]QRK08060.1 hypothetical protein JQX13_50290 [Archangium violaceum]